MIIDRQIILSLAAIAVGLFAVYSLAEFVDARRISLPASYADADLDLQGRRLKGFAFGAEGMLADWYWIRSLQYVGDKILKYQGEINVEDLRPLDPRLLYPMLDNATDLDPHFMAAYSYGALVLPAIDSGLAVKLTEKGIANNPEAWRLYQYLGYIHWRNGNYEAAAVAYDTGSRIAGSAVFMKQMAALMRTQGGSRETARQMYTQLAAEAEDEQARFSAELRLKQLESLDERDAVNAALEDLRDRAGKCSTRISELPGLLRPERGSFRVNERGELVDPTGVPYVLNVNECRIELSETSKIPRN